MEKLKCGQPISLKLSDYLKEFTGPEDVADASVETGVSISTINYVKRRVGNVSVENEKGILMLARKAYKNAEAKKRSASKCQKELKLILEN